MLFASAFHFYPNSVEGRFWKAREKFWNTFFLLRDKETRCSFSVAEIHAFDWFPAEAI